MGWPGDWGIHYIKFVIVEVLQTSQSHGVMSSASKRLTSTCAHSFTRD